MVLDVVYREVPGMGYDALLSGRQVGANTTFQVSLGDLDLEVVVLPAAPDGEVPLILLEGHCEPDLGAEHHLGALHEVAHDILEFGHESLLVDEDEVDLLVSGDLDSHVALDVVNLASDFRDLVVLSPLLSLRVDLEEEHGSGGLGHEDLVEDQVHGAKLRDIECLELGGLVLRIQAKALALSVEGVALLFLVRVEGLDRVVPYVRLRKLYLLDLAFWLARGNIKNEVVLLLLEPVVCADEHLVVGKNGGGDAWVVAAVDWLGGLVSDMDKLGNVDVAQLSSIVVVEPDKELAVVLVSHAELGALCAV